jgi:Zn finger protein HypA/HybF involved in hydrogenase expression
MDSDFTNKAKAMWRALSPEAQEKILNAVWCSHCVKATTIVDFSGYVEKKDLILRGRCATCGGQVARLIEGDYYHQR